MRLLLRFVSIGILVVSCSGDPFAPTVTEDPYQCVPGELQTRRERYPDALRLVVGAADVTRAYRVVFDNCSYQEMPIDGLVVTARDPDVVAVTQEEWRYGPGSNLVEARQPGSTWVVFEAADMLDSIPVEVPDTVALGGVESVAAGGPASCATSVAGELFCWGAAWHPALASSELDPRVGTCFGAPCTPMPLSVDGVRVRRAFVGPDAACLVTATGSVECSGALAPWGPIDGALSDIVVGYAHACALDVDGHAQCWGSNTLGQLGRGDFTEGPGAAPVLGDKVWRSIGVDGTTTCGVSEEGYLYCWGRLPNDQPGAVLCESYSGKGGTFETYCSASPVLVSLGDTTNPDTIAVQVAGRCVLTEEGTPLCTEGGRLRFERIATSQRFMRIGAGRDHYCGLTADGSAYCWGANDAGQLGDGSSVMRTTPQPVSGGHRFTELALGDAHSCGISDGAVWCWGANDYGQAGGSIVEWPRVPRKVRGQGAP